MLPNCAIRVGTPGANIAAKVSHLYPLQLFGRTQPSKPPREEQPLDAYASEKSGFLHDARGVTKVRPLISPQLRTLSQTGQL